jgi:hypothetical protein
MELHATEGRPPRNPEEAASMLLTTMEWIARTATARPERFEDVARVAEFAVADALAAGLELSGERD